MEPLQSPNCPLDTIMDQEMGKYLEKYKLWVI